MGQTLNTALMILVAALSIACSILLIAWQGCQERHKFELEWQHRYGQWQDCGTGYCPPIDIPLRAG